MASGIIKIINIYHKKEEEEERRNGEEQSGSHQEPSQLKVTW